MSLFTRWKPSTSKEEGISTDNAYRVNILSYVLALATLGTLWVGPSLIGLRVPLGHFVSLSLAKVWYLSYGADGRRRRKWNTIRSNTLRPLRKLRMRKWYKDRRLTFDYHIFDSWISLLVVLVYFKNNYVSYAISRFLIWEAVSGAIKPIIMNRLISLRHLYAHPNTIDLLSGIGSLTNLQELEEFHVLKQKGNTISELMDILAISGQLVIRYLNNVSSKEEAINTKDILGLCHWYGAAATMVCQMKATVIHLVG